jgi:hypothetical protein
MSNIKSVFMILHTDTLDDIILNQFKIKFQTVISIENVEWNDELLSYHSLQIKDRNFKSGKVSNYKEVVHLTNSLVINKIDKETIKTSALKKKESEDNENNKDESPQLFEGLTFNVHLNSNDLQAKRNLVLPYELIK